MATTKRKTTKSKTKSAKTTTAPAHDAERIYQRMLKRGMSEKQARAFSKNAAKRKSVSATGGSKGRRRKLDASKKPTTRRKK